MYGILYSGGKDSHLSLCLYRDKISSIIRINAEKFSKLFHWQARDFVMKHSEQLKLPLIESTSLEDAITKSDISGIVSGVTASNYQRNYLIDITKRYGIELINPLWNIDFKKYIDLIKAFRIKAIIIGVFAYPLEKDFVGKDYLEVLPKLIEYNKKYGVNLFGEGGEFETLVVESNFVKIDLPNLEIKGKNNSYYYDF